MWLFKRLFWKSEENTHDKKDKSQPIFKKVGNIWEVCYTNWDVYLWQLNWKIKQWFWKYTFKNWNIYEWYRENDKRNWYWEFTFSDWTQKKLNRIDWEADLKRGLWKYNHTIEWWDENWINIYTWTEYDWWWFNQSWWNKDWINKYTWTKYDERWYNKDWIHKNKYDLYHSNKFYVYDYEDDYNYDYEYNTSKNSYETNVTANNNSYYKKWEKNNEYIENKNSGNLNTFHYIWVQFESEIYPGTFYWNTYTYKTMKTFHFWDIIYAPTSNWTKKARVLETNKSISSINCPLSIIKEI
jgi:hypothetical protein